jgi:hypothetical protein
MVQRLEEGDEARWLDLCWWVSANCRLIPSVLFTDEAKFTRDSINNTHNSHWWSDKNPHAIVEGNSQHHFCKRAVRCDQQSADWACCVIESSYWVRICRLSAKWASTIIAEGSFGEKDVHGLPAWQSPCTLLPSGDTLSNIPQMMDWPQWSCTVATKVPRPYSFRFLSVGMDEKWSLQRRSKHKWWIGHLHYE